MNHRKEHTDICENVYVHMQSIYKILAFFTFYPMCVCVCVCVWGWGMPSMAGMFEDNLWELVLSFYLLVSMVDPIDWVQVIRLDNKHLYSQSLHPSIHIPPSLPSLYPSFQLSTICVCVYDTCFQFYMSLLMPVTKMESRTLGWG